MTNIAKFGRITNVTKLEKEEGKKGPEMSAIIAKIALPILVTLANWRHFAIFRGSPYPFPFLSVEFC